MKVKFLILRFSSIGDIVLTTPVVRCLKEQVEGAEIHFATKKQFASVVANNPNIDKIHLLEGSLNKLIAELQQENFDYIIDLHHNLRTFIIKMRLSAVAFSFQKLNFEKWLMVQLKKNRLPQKHIVDRYLDTCSFFDLKNDQKGLDFYIEEKNEVDLQSLPLAFHRQYIALVIGAKHATKQMPDEMIASLCSKIDLPIMLMGGPDEKDKAANIILQTSNVHVFNACGGFNLQQSASLVRQATLVITHDTGLMHIAAAFKKNIFSLWGNTIPAFGMYPYVSDNEQIMFEVKGLSCRPCSKIGYQKCPKNHFKCMRMQDLKTIAEHANTAFNQ